MKKFLIGFCVAFVALSSQAEYLWWTVNNDDYASTVGSYLTELKADGKITSYKQVYANIVAKDSSGNIVGEYDYGFTSEWGTGTKGMAVDMKDLLGDNYSGAQGYTYYIEIASTKSGVGTVGYNAQAQTYAQMQNAGSITSDMTPVAQAEVWHGGAVGGYKATPEPTSAMLMLLGVAGLALRRKQRKSAE